MGQTKVENMLIVVIGLICLVMGIWACAGKSQHERDTHRGTKPVADSAMGGVQPSGPFITAESSQREETPEDRAKRIAAIMERVVLPESPLVPVVRLRFDDHRQPVEINRIPGSYALDMAARYYAVATLDFDPTPRKLIDAGFWPFTNVPADQLDKGLTGIGRYPILMYNGEDTWEFLEALSITGKLDAKLRILSAYYTHVVKETTASELTSTLNKLEGLMNAKFWINPVTGKPMQQSQTRGDWRMVDTSDATDIPYHGQGSSSGLVQGCPVPMVNPTSIEVAPLNAGKSVSSSNCCVYKFVYTNGYGGSSETFSETFNCNCGSNIFSCIIEWYYQC